MSLNVNWPQKLKPVCRIKKLNLPHVPPWVYTLKIGSLLHLFFSFSFLYQACIVEFAEVKHAYDSCSQGSAFVSSFFLLGSLDLSRLLHSSLSEGWARGQAMSTG